MTRTKSTLCTLGLWALLAVPVVAAAAPDCTVTIKPGVGAKAQALAQDAAKTNPCLLVPGLTPKSLSAVWSALLSTPKTGGKRFDTPPPEGLPAGRMLLADTGLRINLQAVVGEGVLALQIVGSGDGAPIFNVNNPTQAVFVVPAARFKMGMSYDWRLTTRQASYKASFELLDADETKLVQARLVALAAAELSPQLRQLYQAAIFDEAELYTARDLVLDDIKRQLAP